MFGVLASSSSHAESPKATSYVLELGSVRVEANDGSVLIEKLNDDAYIRKPSAGKHDEVALKGGVSLAREVAGAIGDGFTKDCAKKIDGGLALVGAEGGELARVAFAWAVVTEIAMPSLDASATSAAEVSVKLEPQFPRRIFQKGAVAKPTAGPAWKKSSFKLAIDGLASSLKAVKQVGEVKISQTASASAPVTCTATVISDLVFAVPTSDAAAFAGWKDAKNGTLDYLAADGSTVVRVKLGGLKKKSQAAEGALTRITASVETAAVQKN